MNIFILTLIEEFRCSELAHLTCCSVYWLVKVLAYKHNFLRRNWPYIIVIVIVVCYPRQIHNINHDLKFYSRAINLYILLFITLPFLC